MTSATTTPALGTGRRPAEGHGPDPLDTPLKETPNDDIQGPVR